MSTPDETSDRVGSARSARVVAVVGNPRPGSRTAGLARAAAGSIAALLEPDAGGPDAVDVRTLDLAELTEQLGAPLGADSGGRWAEPLAALHAADVLIVATPVYKGSYTGLLKSFLDHVGGGALRDVVAVPVVTPGNPAHSLAADVFLRPLLAELGASQPTEALVVQGPELDDPQAALAGWLERNERVLRRTLGLGVAERVTVD